MVVIVEEQDATADAALDGRRQRSERSRAAVLDAMLGLYEAGEIRPSAMQIAEAAGVSERSLFRHFADLEDVASSAIARQFAIVAPYFAPPSNDGDLAQRVDAIVDQRIALAERMHHLARAAAHHATASATIATAVADRRRRLRDQVSAQFGPELRALRGRRRTLLAATLDHALSLEALDYLGDPTGGDLSVRDLRSAVHAHVVALLHGALDPTITSSLVP